MTKQNAMLTTKEVAEIVGLSEYTISKYRMMGIGPKFFQLGNKIIRYKRNDVYEWLNALTKHKAAKH